MKPTQYMTIMVLWGLLSIMSGGLTEAAEPQSVSPDHVVDAHAKDHQPDAPETPEVGTLLVEIGHYKRKDPNSPILYRAQKVVLESGKRVKQGLFLYYHRNGQLQGAVDYKLGKKHGKQVTYLQDGTLEEVRFYLEDHPTTLEEARAAGCTIELSDDESTYLASKK